MIYLCKHCDNTYDTDDVRLYQLGNLIVCKFCFEDDYLTELEHQHEREMSADYYEEVVKHDAGIL